MTTAQQNDEVSLVLPQSGTVINTWTQYSFHSNFLTPTDEFSFTIAHEKLPPAVAQELVAGTQVSLLVNSLTQATGYIDDVDIVNNREGGTEFMITGRDVLAPAVDSNMDPRQRFAEGQTLAQFLESVFAPYGWVGDTAFVIDNDANLDVLTGSLQGTRTSKKGKALASVVLHQLKPYQGEGAFAFASRISQRHGLWIWPSADGLTLIVGKPQQDRTPIASLKRGFGQDSTKNSILSGGAKRSLRDQPSIVVAQCFGGGGEFQKSNMTVLAVNPAVIADNNDILQTYASAVRVTLAGDYAEPITSKTARPVFLKDDESHTQEQLENFVVRELSLRLRKAFSANYEVRGHTQNGIPWSVDTVVQVDDDRARVHEPLYVIGRTFSKSRGGGTRTHLELIRPGTLSFGGIVQDPSTGQGVASPTDSNEDNSTQTSGSKAGLVGTSGQGI